MSSTVVCIRNTSVKLKNVGSLLCFLVVICHSVEGRPQNKEPIPCITVTSELFQPYTGIFPKGLPEQSRLSGSRRTLGVLFPQGESGYTLRLIRAGELIGEYWLRAPTGRPFEYPPAFALAEDGDISILKVVDHFAVYARSALVGSFQGSHAHAPTVTASRGYLLWAPTPRPENVRRFLSGAVLQETKDFEWPPLLLRSEYDGQDEKVLLRLDRAEIEKGDHIPMYHALVPVVRSDGKLWLVGPFSGKVMLAENNGSIKRSFVLSDLLKRPEDDPEIRKKRDEDMRLMVEKDEAESHTDATKPKPNVEAFRGNKSRLFHYAFARGTDLVLNLATISPPSGSILLIPSGDEQHPVCLQFPSLVGTGPETPLELAVTDNEVWFRKPFGYISWDAIDNLVAEEKAKAVEKQHKTASK